MDFEEFELENIKYSFNPTDDNLVKGRNELTISLEIKFLNDPRDAQQRLSSKKKIKEMISWLNSTEEDFRDLDLELNLSEIDKFNMIFKDMFIDYISQDISSKYDIGIYKVSLKQKYYSSDSKIIIKGVE